MQLLHEHTTFCLFVCFMGDIEGSLGDSCLEYNEEIFMFVLIYSLNKHSVTNNMSHCEEKTSHCF